MMQQWHTCKIKAGDAILFFRLGDFYEAFYEDAALISKDAGLTLTHRQNIPMAGIPYHTAPTYIDRLIAKGHKIAIAEQMELTGKGLVKREIVRIITPGTQIQSSLLEDSKNNFIACLVLGGAAFLDLTTGQFMAVESTVMEELEALFCQYQPVEILFPAKLQEHPLLCACKQNFKNVLSPQQDGFFDYQSAEHRLKTHFKVLSLDGLGFKNKPSSLKAAGSLLNYLSDYLNLQIQHIHKINHYTSKEFLFLDRTTQKNLELIESINKESTSPTLFQILDKTTTPMGSRLLKQWLVQPLARYEPIIERQLSVENLLKTALPLEGIRDLERLTMRITSAFASPRDLIALKNTLKSLPALKNSLQNMREKLLQENNNAIGDFSDLTKLLVDSLLDEVPNKVGEGPLFKSSYSPELSALYTLSLGCKDWLLTYQNTLRLETGIKSLKVAYTNAFGYFIEVSRSQSNRMPAFFQKRQTLISSERFITEELKNFEQRALSSEDQIIRLETKLLEELRSRTSSYAEDLFKAARAIAIIDCLQSLAFVANSYGYVKPEISIGYALDIEDGRHPVIEKILTGFTPNSTKLNENQKLMVLTGPNMGGKSTYIRQVALITLMAHLGSFVPAKKALIPLIDKIFTRIGANDDLSRGQSTFMVEMTETAHILNMATPNSLVILDEIGRGTSTFDGISIAWSVAEYLLQEKSVKTLFATHYFELTDLHKKKPEAFNAHVAVQESQGSLIFLHRILKGPANRSFGIQVAELAGLPAFVIKRAKEIQEDLEKSSLKLPIKKSKPQLYQNELYLFDRI